MPYIAYPYSVKHEGVDYPPHAPIRVDDPAKYPGAAVVPGAPSPSETPRKRGKKAEVRKDDAG